MGCECGYKVQTPCPAGCQFQAVKTRSLVFLTGWSLSPSLRTVPFLDANLHLNYLNYTTQTKLEWSGFQYSLAALHQLSIWPSVFPSSKQKIKRCFAREWQSLVRRNLPKCWELPIIFFKLQLSVLAA